MNATLMSGSSTGDKRAMNILRELHAAEKELVGRAVVLTDGKEIGRASCRERV